MAALQTTSSPACRSASSVVVVAAMPLDEQQRRLGAFERGELLLDREHRRVRVARVEELRRPALVVGHHLLRVLEDEGRRLVDRRRERLARSRSTRSAPVHDRQWQLAASSGQSSITANHPTSLRSPSQRLDRRRWLTRSLAAGDDRLDELAVGVFVAAIDELRERAAAGRTARRRRRRNRAGRADCAPGGSRRAPANRPSTARARRAGRPPRTRPSCSPARPRGSPRPELSSWRPAAGRRAPTRRSPARRPRTRTSSSSRASDAGPIAHAVRLAAPRAFGRQNVTRCGSVATGRASARGERVDRVIAADAGQIEGLGAPRPPVGRARTCRRSAGDARSASSANTHVAPRVDVVHGDEQLAEARLTEVLGRAARRSGGRAPSRGGRRNAAPRRESGSTARRRRDRPPSADGQRRSEQPPQRRRRMRAARRRARHRERERNRQRRAPPTQQTAGRPDRGIIVGSAVGANSASSHALYVARTPRSATPVRLSERRASPTRPASAARASRTSGDRQQRAAGRQRPAGNPQRPPPP